MIFIRFYNTTKKVNINKRCLVDWYGFRIIKPGVTLKTFGDIDFSKKADIIGVEGMFKSLGLDLVKKS